MTRTAKKTEPTLLALTLCLAIALQCVTGPLHGLLMQSGVKLSADDWPFGIVLCSVLAMEPADAAAAPDREDTPVNGSVINLLADTCPLCSAMALAQFALFGVLLALLLPEARSGRSSRSRSRLTSRRMRDLRPLVRAPPVSA